MPPKFAPKAITLTPSPQPGPDVLVFVRVGLEAAHVEVRDALGEAAAFALADLLVLANLLQDRLQLEPRDEVVVVLCLF